MASTAFPSRDDFAALLNESFGGADGGFEGRVVKGTVTGVENDMVPRRGRDLRPRQGRLHRRSRRRRGVPAGQPGRHPPRARRHPADGTPQPFQILKMDRAAATSSSRAARAGREPRRAAHRSSSPEPEGRSDPRGVVKNITDYGAFVDLGGVDGLLHVTDIAGKRINHPSECSTSASR
jgi:ribosomal protein S1